MKPVSARRELAIVLALAVLGLVLVSAVAFMPWYEPAGHPGAAVVHTVPPPGPATAVLMP